MKIVADAKASQFKSMCSKNYGKFLALLRSGPVGPSLYNINRDREDTYTAGFGNSLMAFSSAVKLDLCLNIFVSYFAFLFFMI